MTEPWNNFDLADIEGEEWREVASYDGLYHVSNLGRVKSLERWVERRSNGGYWAKPRIRKAGKVPHGGHAGRYSYMVPLSDTSGRVQNHTVARLVVDAFGPQLEAGQSIHHINGLSHDNRHRNLTTEDRSTKRKIEYDLGLREHARAVARLSPIALGKFRPDNIHALLAGANVAPKRQSFKKRNAMVVTLEVPSTGYKQAFTSVRSAAEATGIKEYSIRNAMYKPHKYKRFSVTIGALE